MQVFLILNTKGIFLWHKYIEYATSHLFSLIGNLLLRSSLQHEYWDEKYVTLLLLHASLPANQPGLSAYSYLSIVGFFKQDWMKYMTDRKNMFFTSKSCAQICTGKWVLSFWGEKKK